MNNEKRISVVALAFVSLFTSLTAIGAFIRIPIPFVPFTLQILFVYLAGSLLGSRLGGGKSISLHCDGVVRLTGLYGRWRINVCV